MPAVFHVISELDPVVRFAALGILVTVTILIVRDASNLWAGRFSALFSSSICFYLFCSYGPAREALGPAFVIFGLVCTAVPGLFWLTAKAIFSDGFRPKFIHIIPIIALELLGLTAIVVQSGFEAFAIGRAFVHQALSFSLYVYGLHSAWATRKDDLIEGRRRFRHYFIFLSAVLGLSVTIFELISYGSSIGAVAESGAALAIFITALGLAIVVLRLDPHQFFAPTDESSQTTKQTSRALTQEEERLLERVRQLVEVECIYRTDGLSIRVLAENLKTDEYKVRRVINGGLGYRNFSAYLNCYRVEDVKKALADPNLDHIPILTLALQAGFGSIAPFNRSFKEQVGVTPTVFRKQHLGQAPKR